MAYKSVNKYCPHFCEGNCKNGNCKYNYHIKCNYNVICFNFECQYGHSVSSNLRKLFKEIVDENTNPQYEKSKNKCYYAINCFKTTCMRDHMITSDAMMFVNHILKERINYDDAKSMYKLQFKQQQSPDIRPIESIDKSLESDLLNLTEIEDEIITPVSNYHEDMKSKLLQELMVSQNNIRNIIKSLYEKDIAIQHILNQRKILENEMFKNRSKIQQLIITLNIMNNT